MAIEEHFKPDSINIKNLTLGSERLCPDIPRDPNAFDSKKDITEENWRLMRAKAEENRKNKKIFLYVKNVCEMNIISREKAPRLPAIHIKTRPSATDWDHLRFLQMIKTCDPKMINESHLNEEDFEFAIEQIRSEFEQAKWKNFWWLAETIKILFADMYPEKYKRFEESYVIPAFELMGGEIDNLTIGGNWSSYEMASEMKVVSCDEFEKIGIRLNWPEIKRDLTTERNRKLIGMFITAASKMSILAAGSVEITENGLEISAPKKKNFAEGISLPPSIRKF